MNPFKAVFITALVLGVLASMAIGGCWLRGRGVSLEAAAGDGVDEAERRLLAESELDKAKQKAIWDAEHVTFMLERRVGVVFLDAWKRRDAERLSAFFQPETAARVLPAGEEHVIHHGLLTERRREDASTAVASDRTGLVEKLLESIEPFTSIERTGFRVLQIARADPASDRWSAEILLTAHGTHAGDGPIAAESRHRIELVMTDKDELAGSSLIDRWDQLSDSVRTSARFLMQEATESFGLRRVPLEDNWNMTPSQANRYRHQYAVADFNRDGYLDVAIATFGGGPMLLESDGGRRLVDATSKLMIRGERGGNSLSFLAAWLDYDNDGYPDLLLGGRLFRNERGRRLVDVTEISGLYLDPYAMGCAVADYDCDGLLDLYLLYQERPNLQSDGPRKERWVNEENSGWENQLWRNEGGGRFSNVTRFAAAGGGARHSFAAAWMFYDDDHYPDLYVANDFGKNVLLRNRGDGTFEDVSAASGAADYATSMGVATGDIDNDGRTDIYVANMYSKMGRRIIGHVGEDDYPEGIFEQIKGACAGNSLYVRPVAGQRYQEAGIRMGVNEVGWAFGPAMVDLDGDGLLDLYATTGFMSFSRSKPDG